MIDVRELVPDPGYKVSTFFKYVSCDEKVIESILSDHKIRFTQPRALNDPLESNPSIKFNKENSKIAKKSYILEGKTIPSYEYWIRLHLEGYYSNSIGVFSLTKKPDNYLMWSSYASGHSGIVLEFSKDILKYEGFFDKNIKDPLRKVRYTGGIIKSCGQGARKKHILR